MISAGSHFLRYTHCTPRWLRTGTQLELVCRRHSLVPWNGSYQECQAPFRFIPRTHHTYLFFVSAIFLWTNSVFPVALFDPFPREVSSTHLVNKKKGTIHSQNHVRTNFFHSLAPFSRISLTDPKGRARDEDIRTQPGRHTPIRFSFCLFQKRRK